jgi:hypothetical protein
VCGFDTELGRPHERIGLDLHHESAAERKNLAERR